MIGVPSSANTFILYKSHVGTIAPVMPRGGGDGLVEAARVIKV
jgi:hypothetical protein